MRIDAFFSEVYRPRKLFGKSENTTRLYRLSIKSFGDTLGRPAELSDLSDDNLQRHMERVVANGRSTATANKDRSQLLALWRYAFLLKKVENVPNVQAYKEPTRTPMAWLHDEVASLLRATDLVQGKFGRIPQKLWWKAIIRLSLDTGERIGAVFKAEWDWFQGEWFMVPAEARKGSRSDRSYRLSSETAALINEIKDLRQPGSKIFFWPYCDMYLWTKYKQLLVIANLPHGRRDKFHKLRRTTASVSYAAGLDPQEVLDHQYRRTSKKYLDPRFVREVTPSDVLSAFLANPGLGASLGQGQAQDTQQTRVAN